MATGLERVAAWAYPVCPHEGWRDIACSTAYIGMVETLKIAFIATVFGTMLSLPLSSLRPRT